MLLGLLIFAFIASFFLAKLEIQIEGKNGWARDLPTWKKKNILISKIIGDYYLTGYHTWLVLTLLVFLNFPFFIGFPWSLSLEIKILAVFFFGACMEDVFWILLNPDYGIKKFNKKYITWHKQWVGFIPAFHLKYVIIGEILLILSYLF
ncbi:MAG: hypothetical protein M1324_01610 [Patescibacteria group bacterium]|nr:hypothetical protein [Actinomycetota bacterium]MCL5410533.1 hypothetical protein [Patescibacteria group bacterium]